MWESQLVRDVCDPDRKNETVTYGSKSSTGSKKQSSSPTRIAESIERSALLKDASLPLETGAWRRKRYTWERMRSSINRFNRTRSYQWWTGPFAT